VVTVFELRLDDGAAVRPIRDDHTIPQPQLDI
jgi:hypothetical protein